MLTFTLRRLASGLGLLVVISMLTYTLLFFSSTAIARNILGEQATPEQIALKEAELGLDQPLPVRYLGWATAALRGDLGESWFNGEPVTQTILNRLPVTLVLMIVSIVLVALIATALGVLAAVRRGRVDQTVQVGAVVGDAIPGFVLALVLVTIFAVNLGWFPAVSTIRPGSGPEAWIVSLSLPVIAIVLNYVTSSAQQIRSAVIKEARQGLRPNASQPRAGRARDRAQERAAQCRAGRSDRAQPAIHRPPRRCRHSRADLRDRRNRRPLRQRDHCRRHPRRHGVVLVHCGRRHHREPARRRRPRRPQPEGAAVMTDVIENPIRAASARSAGSSERMLRNPLGILSLSRPHSHRARRRVRAPDRAVRPELRRHRQHPAPTRAVSTCSAPTARAATCSRGSLYGARLTLLSALLCAVVAIAIGLPAGLIAGYYGGCVRQHVELVRRTC